MDTSAATTMIKMLESVPDQLQEDNLPIPESTSFAEYVAVNERHIGASPPQL